MIKTGSGRTGYVIVLLYLVYPILIYVGLHFFSPVWIALSLLVLAGLKLFDSTASLSLRLAWPVTAIIVVAGVFATQSEQAVLLYPVLINMVLFIVFITSYFRPPTVIELLARTQEPDLPESGIRYTRKVTLVWCIFFLLNGSIAFLTTLMDRDWWLFYNGFAAYLLMATLFLAEMIVRKRIRAGEK